MKKITLSIILIISCLTQLYSQQPYTIDTVIQIPGVTADTLYLLSKQWYVTSFNTPKKVIQDDSRDLRIVSGKGAMQYSYGKLSYLSYEGFVTYLIQIQSRDERIKVTITNVYHENLPTNASSSNLGLIGDEKIQFKKGIGKNYHNNVVNDIQNKITIYSEIIFKEIEDYLKKKQTREEVSW